MEFIPVFCLEILFGNISALTVPQYENISMLKAEHKWQHLFLLSDIRSPYM